MSEIIQTLHPKDDLSVDLYPNIKKENIPDKAVTSEKLAENSVTTTKIADNSVTTNKLDTSSVSTANLINQSVTKAKIADKAVSVDKIDVVEPIAIGTFFLTYNNVSPQLSGFNFVDMSTYADKQWVTNQGFLTSVNTANIVNGAVTPDKLNTDNIPDGGDVLKYDRELGKMVWGLISGENIDDEAIDNSKIAQGAVDFGQLKTETEPEDQDILRYDSGGGGILVWDKINSYSNVVLDLQTSRTLDPSVLISYTLNGERMTSGVLFDKDYFSISNQHMIGVMSRQERAEMEADIATWNEEYEKMENLFNPSTPDAVINNVTCVKNSDNTYTCNGTATGVGYFTLGSIYLKQGHYKLVGNLPNTNCTLYVDTGFWQGDSGYGKEIIIENDGSYYVSIYVPSGTTLNNVVFKPMISKNLDVTIDDYKPYTGEILHRADVPDYSTSEVNTHQKWIDDKDIYRKVLYVSNCSSQVSTVMGTIPNNVNVVSLKGIAKFNGLSSYSFPLPYVDNSQTYQGVSLMKSGNEIIVYSTSWSLTDVYAIVEYTK